jgi:hypothetical protein
MLIINQNAYYPLSLGDILWQVPYVSDSHLMVISM